MFYEIDSIESLDNGLSRCVVLFWNNRAEYLRDRNKTTPLLIEDFVSNIQGTGTRIITDSEGRWKLADGTFVRPDNLDFEKYYEFAREEFEVDLASEFFEQIENYIERNGDSIIRGEWKGDRTSHELARRTLPPSQRLNDLNRSSVRGIVRTGRESRIVRGTL